MPWTVRNSRGVYRVVNKSTGKTVGTHSDPSQAEAQRRALYANYYNGSKKRKREMPAPGNSYSDAVRRRMSQARRKSSYSKDKPIETGED